MTSTLPELSPERIEAARQELWRIRWNDIATREVLSAALALAERVNAAPMGYLLTLSDGR